MAVHEIEQPAECLAYVTSCLLEAIRDVLAEDHAGQKPELERRSLAVERTLPIRKEREHHSRVRPGEDVGHAAAVVLNHTANERIQLHLENDLELVEGDQDRSTGLLVQLAREVECIEQGTLAGFSSTHRQAGAAERALNPQGAAAPAQGRPSRTQRSSRKNLISTLYLRGHLTGGASSVEVDQDGPCPRRAGIGDRTVQQARLAVVPRAGQARVNAIAASLGQYRELVFAIDEIVRGQGPVKDKGVCHTYLPCHLARITVANYTGNPCN